MESTNDRDGYACLRNHQARHQSGFANLPHGKNLNSIVIGVISGKVGGNLGDISLIQDNFHTVRLLIARTPPASRIYPTSMSALSEAAIFRASIPPSCQKAICRYSNDSILKSMVNFKTLN